MSSDVSLRIGSRAPLALAGELLAPRCASRGASLFVLLGIALASATADATPELVRDGRRWIGTAANCATVPAGWTGQRLFSMPSMPTSLAQYCLYIWSATRKPTPTNIADLFSPLFGISNLGQDEPVVYPLNAVARESFSQGLRSAVVQRVGGLSIFPSPPQNSSIVRVVVIDSAPDSPHGAIAMGANRHGDTLTHLIEDLVCQPLVCTGACTPAQLSARVCVSQVTTKLALPWTSASSSSSSDGGHLGTLGDLARAIARSAEEWPSWGPQRRVIMNLSVGWEHSDHFANCSTSSTNDRGPESAVKAILQFAASRGALIFAAAGNDSGGPTPRTGLLCPAAYQAIPKVFEPSQPLLIAVSGMDYADHPLETTRPGGITGFTALGLGGVSWIQGQPMPPQLVGSSVATAVTSAVAALVWSQKTSFSAQQVLGAMYAGGVSVGTADVCPVSLSGCSARRVNTCGALHAAGLSVSCTPPSGGGTGSPLLPAELTQLKAAYASHPVSYPVDNGIVEPSLIPRFQQPSPQVMPAVFPQPISATCPTCVVSNGVTSMPRVIIPELGESLTDATLVLVTLDDESHSLSLGTLVANQTYVFHLPPGIVARSAYLTGISTPSNYSVTEQLFLGED